MAEKVRGRAQVRVSIDVSATGGSNSILGTQLAEISVKDEVVLDRGDGSLVDNEYTFTDLLGAVAKQAREKAQGVLDGQWVEFQDEAKEERRAEQLDAAQRFIDAGEAEDQTTRATILGGFLDHDFAAQA